MKVATTSRDCLHAFEFLLGKSSARAQRFTSFQHKALSMLGILKLVTIALDLIDTEAYVVNNLRSSSGEGNIISVKSSYGSKCTV